MHDPFLWALLLISVALNCLFAATHYALQHFSHSRMELHLVRSGRARLLPWLIDQRDPLTLLSGVLRLVTNLMVLVSTVLLFWPESPEIQPTKSTVFAGLLTGGLLIMIFGVTIPVSWAQHGGEQLLSGSIVMLRSLYVLFRPIIRVLQGLDPVVRRLLGVTEADEDDLTESEQDILDAVSEGESTGQVEQQQAQMIHAVVRFSDTTVDQVMTPRTDIEGLEVSASLEDVKKFVRSAGHSRIPIYEDSIDHILGFLYVKDLTPWLGVAISPDQESESAPGVENFKLRKIVRPAEFVPESKTLGRMLSHFKSHSVHIAIVLDEYGGTAGLITVEDIVEEIFGELKDEFEPPDDPDPTIHRINDRVAEAEGRVPVDEVNNALHLQLPEDEDYDTIGGFVFSTLGHIPDQGECFDYENIRVTVLQVNKTRVDRVRIEVLDRAATADSPAPESSSGK